MSENSENGENSEIFYCLEPSCKQNRLITDYKEIIQHVVEKHNIVEYDKFQELLSQKFSELNIQKMLGNEVIKKIQDIMLEKIQNLCDQINRLKDYFFNVFPNEFDKYILPTSSIIQTAQKFKNLVFSNEYKDNILFFEKEMTQFMEAYQNDFLTQNKYQLLFEKIQLDVEAFQFEFKFDVQPIIETFQNWINNYDSNQNKLIKSEPKIIDLFNNNQIQSQPKMVDNHHSLIQQQKVSYRRLFEFQILGKGRHVEISDDNCSVSSSKQAQVMINVVDKYLDLNLNINKIEPYPGQKNKIKIVFYREDEEEILTVYNKRLLIGNINISMGYYFVSVSNKDNNFEKKFYTDYSSEIQEFVIFFTGYEIDIIQ